MKRKLVQVTWIDSSLQNGQVDKSGFPYPALIITTGVQVAKSKESITVARDDMGDGDYRGLCCIPTECIRQVERLMVGTAHREVVG